MKFLQIGDLHLGKKLYEFSLYDEQIFMLEQIIALLKEEPYDALFITGDIYDQSNPAQISLQLFGEFLENLRKYFPSMSVFIISGNHDSPIRLAYAGDIFKTQNIFIETTFSENSKPIIFERNGERCAIFMLPFLQNAILKKEIENGIMEQVEVMEEAVHILKQNIVPDMPNILLAHLLTFANENAKLDSAGNEILYWGTAQVIPKEFFQFFDYVALGHIHRMQKITERMYYSGSPFAYSFKEAENENYKKYALRVEINCHEKNPLPIVEAIPIPQLRKLRTLTGTFSEFISTDTFNSYHDDYLQICLLDSSAVESAMQLLQKKFPHLMTVQQKTFEGKFIGIQHDSDLETLDEKSFEEMYQLFIREVESETDSSEIALAKNIWDEEEEIL